jgi:hypothetical protein
MHSIWQLTHANAIFFFEGRELYIYSYFLDVLHHLAAGTHILAYIVHTRTVRRGMASSSALTFTVRRKPAVLLTPAAPTPRELKPLSDVDDQNGLRFLIANIFFFERRHSGRDVDDPVPVIRNAIAAALVHYYPLAGRIRELEGQKLAVDCTGEGALFVEADADDVRLEQFGTQPPFPGVDELLFDLPGSNEVLDAPLLHFQVPLAFRFGQRIVSYAPVTGGLHFSPRLHLHA